MPKISALPNLTTPAATDQLPINDVSATTTKRMTLTVLKEWFQSLVGWINTNMIASTAVTAAKIDFSTFPASDNNASANVSGATTGSTVSTRSYGFISGKDYLIISKNRYAAASDGGIWTLALKVDGSTIGDSRLSGVASVQYPSIAMGLYTAVATETLAVDVVGIRNSGSGTLNMESQQILIIALPN